MALGWIKWVNEWEYWLGILNGYCGGRWHGYTMGVRSKIVCKI